MRRGGAALVATAGAGSPLPICSTCPARSYKSRPISGAPFDEQRAVVPNEQGRVEPGLYCAGWLKRGPSGIVGTNIADARETVVSLLRDAESGALPDVGDSANTLPALLER